jgi:transcriptional regulator with XRE-family HTH domain
VRSWADTLLSVTGSAADIGLSLAQARVKDPKRKQAVAKAGTQLRRWREAAGLTARELSEAVGLGDAKLLEEAEGGVATLPFEIVLRLAGVLGRNDPIPVAMSLTPIQPRAVEDLESLGVGKLAVQGARDANSPTSTAATMPRASSTTRTSPRCCRSRAGRSRWRSASAVRRTRRPR